MDHFYIIGGEALERNKNTIEHRLLKAFLQFEKAEAFIHHKKVKL